MKKTIFIIAYLFLYHTVTQAQNIDSIDTENIQKIRNSSIKATITNDSLNISEMNILLNNIILNTNIDENGYFEISNLSSGTYNISIQSPNYAEYNSELMLNNNEAINIKIKLGKTQIQNSPGILKGSIINFSNDDNIIVIVDKNIYPVIDKNGNFEINLNEGEHSISITSNSYKTFYENFTISNNETIVLNTELYNIDIIGNIEIVANKHKEQNEKLDMITRLPLEPRELSQTISVISEEVIKDQGAQTITEIAKNSPGVTLFGTYGGVQESMSIRGYRGTPVLKNGIQVDSDFRTASISTDVAGIQSVQILKGSAAITQGIGNGLGSPGGVINVVTKTPQFVNKGEVTLSSGSWGLFRPTLDYQAILDKKETVAFRIAGAYQRKDSYRARINNNRIYVNPSFEWHPDNKTKITLEMDYMNDNTTPDRGTVNLFANDTENHLYKVPHNKFFGFGTDNVNTEITTYSAKIVRDINNHLSLRVLYAGAVNNGENIGIGSLNAKIKGESVNMRKRNLTKSGSKDENKAIQLDLIGKDFYTGKIKHTFQTGFDYKMTDVTSIEYEYFNPSIDKIARSVAYTDIIDVTGNITNNLPSDIDIKYFREKSRTTTSSATYGLMLQEVMDFNNYARVAFGLRFSQNTKKANSEATNEAWDPFLSLMLTPIKNISIFGNYATTTDLRSSSRIMIDGGTAGASVSKQFEVGLKTDWIGEKLGFNATYFHIKNNDLTYQVYEGGVPKPYYDFAGDVVRSGIELELTGKILHNLKAILGYSYLDSKYRNSPSYMNGSRPSNAPRNTANAWISYRFDEGFLNNLSIGAGIYYVGDRPINEWNMKQDGHGTIPGDKPFNMPEYTTVNAQLGYDYKNVNLKIFFNNIFDELGYSSYYRGGYINEIAPRNVSVQLGYKF